MMAIMICITTNLISLLMHHNWDILIITGTSSRRCLIIFKCSAGHENNDRKLQHDGHGSFKHISPPHLMNDTAEHNAGNVKGLTV